MSQIKDPSSSQIKVSQDDVLRRFKQWPKGLLDRGCLHLQLKNKFICMFICHTPVTLIKSTYLLTYLWTLSQKNGYSGKNSKFTFLVFSPCWCYVYPKEQKPVPDPASRRSNNDEEEQEGAGDQHEQEVGGHRELVVGRHQKLFRKCSWP